MIKDSSKIIRVRNEYRYRWEWWAEGRYYRMSDRRFDDSEKCVLLASLDMLAEDALDYVEWYHGLHPRKEIVVAIQKPTHDR